MAFNFDAPVSAVTLTGSILSFLATTGVLISFVFYHDQQRSFRHALVLNLTIAEFMNSLDNSISGIIYIKNKELKPGAACVLNGMIGQLSVQASDFSILAIAVVTFLTITRKTYMPSTSTSRKIIICVSVWIVPIITSATATIMGYMEPVSGNWCWISRERPDLRYALTHGWRFAIIFTVILIYMYVWWYLGRHFRSVAITSDELYNTTGTGASSASGGNPVTSSIRKKQGFEPIDSPGLEMDKFDRPKTNNNRPTFVEPFGASSGERIEMSDFPDFPTVVHGGAAAGVQSRIPSAVEEDEVITKPRKASQPAEEGQTKRKMSSRISRFDDFDMDLSQASEARFSYLEQEEKLQGGGHPMFSDIPPPTKSRRPSRQSINEWATSRPKGHRKRSSTISWYLKPRGRDLARDFPLNPNIDPVPSKQATPPQNVTATMMSDFPIRKQTRKVEREIKRMMLLNAYPVMYVVLWIPGLVNRLMEASGHTSQSRVLAALQSSSQYIGLANAITYGFNQHVRHRIKGDVFAWIRRNSR
ncbi:hypothetical protein C8035_v007038 [Colletotrichum spinosum]|uniref:Glucose receptor Git3 N-terminal domain-containing protein n=1 Tax=Colletotrichum spinosum TaxID=1347390 RepID=A0A4R8QF03_9PEZI|nr:hypothetical protein C8035_v007038 [Colletotrichum spinosum]